MSDYTQTNLTDVQHNLLLSTLFLLALHVIVSFVLICVSLRSKKHGIVTSAWVVSLIVTSTSFVLVLLSFIEKSQTPCPIQISDPFVEDKIFGSKTRKDIENTINKLNDIVPGAESPIIPAYSAKRKYLIITKHYLQSLNISVADILAALVTKCSSKDTDFCKKINELLKSVPGKELAQDLDSAHVVPIGYIEGNKIFGLDGNQLIPPPTQDPTPSENFTFM